jgi:pimeloyl-ACP methyl ester carboxylesterase
MTVRIRKTYIETEHGQIHARVAGSADSDATPLICLHMSPASGMIYEKFMAEAGESRQVIALDNPGYGASEGFETMPEIGDYARVIAQAIEALELPGKVDLMGYHTGSLISLELARTRTDLVRRVATIAMPVFTDAELVEFRELYNPESVFTMDGEKLKERWLWYIEFFRVGTINTIEDAARFFISRLSSRSDHWWGHRAAFAYDVRAAAREVDVPMLILNLDDDLREHTPRVMEYLRTAEMADCPQWSHGLLDSHAADVAQFVTSYLDRDLGSQTV